MRAEVSIEEMMPTPIDRVIAGLRGKVFDVVCQFRPSDTVR